MPKLKSDTLDKFDIRSQECRIRPGIWHLEMDLGNDKNFQQTLVTTKHSQNHAWVSDPTSDLTLTCCCINLPKSVPLTYAAADKFLDSAKTFRV